MDKNPFTINPTLLTVASLKHQHPAYPSANKQKMTYTNFITKQSLPVQVKIIQEKHHLLSL